MRTLLRRSSRRQQKKENFLAYLPPKILIRCLLLLAMDCPNCGTEMKAEISKSYRPEADENETVVNRECPSCGSRVEQGYMSLAEAKRSLE